MSLVERVSEVPVECLFLNPSNPRYVSRQESERAAIEALAREQGPKLLALAKSIHERGLAPTEILIVSEIEGEADLYIVLEGNRRIAAIKLLSNPSLLQSIDVPKALRSQLSAVNSTGSGKVPATVPCMIMSEADARHWILLRHTGENGGEGIVGWDGSATDRFRENNSIVNQALSLVHGRLSEDALARLPKFPVTNLQRVLKSKDAGEILGFRISDDGDLVITDGEKSIEHLSIVVERIARKLTKVTNIDNVKLIKEFAGQVVAGRLGRTSEVREPDNLDTSEGDSDNTEHVGENTESGTGTGIAGDVSIVSTRPNSRGHDTTRNRSPDRQSLIPLSFKLDIGSVPKINKIYHELKKLSAKDMPHSCAVMLRVFIELSVEEYLKRKAIGSSDRLKDNLLSATQRLMDDGTCTAKEVEATRLYASGDNLFSIRSLQQFVHNAHFSPTPEYLKTFWDNIEPFIRGLWKK